MIKQGMVESSNAIIEQLISCYQSILAGNSVEHYFEMEEQIDTWYEYLKERTELNTERPRLMYLYGLHQQVVSLLEKEKNDQGTQIRKVEIQKRGTSHYVTRVSESFFIDKRQ